MGSVRQRPYGSFGETQKHTSPVLRALLSHCVWQLLSNSQAMGTRVLNTVLGTTGDPTEGLTVEGRKVGLTKVADTEKWNGYEVKEHFIKKLCTAFASTARGPPARCAATPLVYCAPRLPLAQREVVVQH